MTTTPAAFRALMDARTKLGEAYDHEMAAGHPDRARKINELVVAIFAVALLVIPDEDVTVATTGGA